MQKIICLTALLMTTLFSGAALAQKKTEIDYSVFDKAPTDPATVISPDKPVNDQGLLEYDKKTGKETKLSKDFKKGVEIYQQAKPVIDLVGGIFGLGNKLGFLKHIDSNLEYGEWLFGKVPREQQEQGSDIDGEPLGDVFGVDGQIDPSKVRERVLSAIQVQDAAEPDSPFGVSNSTYFQRVGDLAITRTARKNLEIIFGETGQQFAKESREHVGNLVRTSGQMVEQAIEAKSTQDVNKIATQIAANSQLLQQSQFTEQQQTRLAVDRGNQTALTDLEITQQEKWESDLKDAKVDAATANTRQFALSLVLPPSLGTVAKKDGNPKLAANQAPPFIQNRR